MYSLARSLLFRMDAEDAHHLTLSALARAQALGLIKKTRLPEKPLELMGLKLNNPVGLAAGLDKNGECINAWAALGFGFVEVGTVTPRPQPGNPRPRLFRLPEHRAIINRMGFNNLGVDTLIANVEAARRDFDGILGINIGKNADTPLENALEDYLLCLQKVYAHADYITVNISSPNTKNLRQLQAENELGALLAPLNDARLKLENTYRRRVPVAVKIAPDLDDAQIEVIAKVLRNSGMDGVIATNTTIARDAVAGHRLAGESGGLSGVPVREASNHVLGKLVQALDGSLPVIGVGGIMSGADAAAKQSLGAAAIQLYSGLVYRGPALIKECLAAWK